MLATLDLYEELAEHAERSPLSAIRQRMRSEYQRLVGVSPEVRGQMRIALERVREGSGGSVAQLTDSYRRQSQENGSSPSDDKFGWSSSSLPRV